MTRIREEEEGFCRSVGDSSTVLQTLFKSVKTWSELLVKVNYMFLWTPAVVRTRRSLVTGVFCVLNCCYVLDAFLSQCNFSTILCPSQGFLTNFFRHLLQLLDETACRSRKCCWHAEYDVDLLYNAWISLSPNHMPSIVGCSAAVL